MLKVKNIYKSYNPEFLAINNISFEVEKGEMVAVLGETGSGKTTLLKILAGLMDADEGEVIFKNKKVFKGDKLIAGEKGIEVIFQDFELFPNHTLEENIEHKIRHLNSDTRAKQVSELIQILGLDEIKHRLPREISGGQKQKVAIARALATKPYLLLMDEPYSNLDSLSKSDLKTDIKKVLRKNNASAIMVTHSAEDALAFADKIIVMQKGKIIQMGTPQEIYNSPENEYVARFIGDCNILTVNKWGEFFEINDSPRAKYMLRAENIKTAKKGKEVMVKDAEYKGHYYRLLVKTYTGIFFVLYSNEFHALGSIIHIEFELKKLHKLKS